MGTLLTFNAYIYIFQLNSYIFNKIHHKQSMKFMDQYNLEHKSIPNQEVSLYQHECK